MPTKKSTSKASNNTAVINTVSSDKINVFPAGFRNQQYNKSKYTTEDNLVLFNLLSSNLNNHNQIFTDPYDSRRTILYIGGYYFNVLTESIPNSSYYAYIRLIYKDENVGYVLGPCDADGDKLDYILDLPADNTSVIKFKGLGFTTKENLDALTANIDKTSNPHPPKILDIEIRDASGNLLTKKLKLDTSEIRSGSNTDNTDGIDKNFESEYIKAKTGLAASNAEITNIKINGEFKINDKSLISNANLTIGDSLNNNIGKITLKSSDDKDTTIVGPGGGIINLPSNTEDTSMVFIQNNGTSDWLKYSSDAEPQTLVQRDGANNINTRTLNNVNIEVKDNTTLCLGINNEADYKIKVSDDSLQVKLDNDEKIGLNISNNQILLQTQDKKTKLDVVTGAKVDIDASLHVGADQAKGTVNITSAGADATTIIGSNGGEIRLPSNVGTDNNPHVWTQQYDSNNKTYINSWVPIYNDSKKSYSILHTDINGGLNLEDISVKLGSPTSKKITSDSIETKNLITTKELKLTSGNINRSISIDDNGKLISKDLTVSSPAVSGDNTADGSSKFAFIESVRQDPYGKITATKAYLPYASKEAAGAIKVIKSNDNIDTDHFLNDTNLNVDINRYYPLEINSRGLGMVYVPWVDIKTNDTNDDSIEITKNNNIATIEHKKTTTQKTSYVQNTANLAWGSSFNVCENLYDSRGHITALRTSTLTLPNLPDIHKHVSLNDNPVSCMSQNNEVIYYLKDVFTANQAAGPDSSKTVSLGNSFNVPYLEVDKYGRVKNINQRTITLSTSNLNKVMQKNTQNINNLSNNYKPLLMSDMSDGTSPSAYLGETLFNTNVGVNPTTGEIKANSYLATSDERLKTNIKPFVYNRSILDLSVKTFDFKEGAKNEIGCIAQDLLEIYPELVEADDNGFLSIKENKLIYLLLEEVKILKDEINKLKKE